MDSVRAVRITVGRMMLSVSKSKVKIVVVELSCIFTIAVRKMVKNLACEFLDLMFAMC